VPKLSPNFGLSYLAIIFFSAVTKSRYEPRASKLRVNVADHSATASAFVVGTMLIDRTDQLSDVPAPFCASKIAVTNGTKLNESRSAQNAILIKNKMKKVSHF